MEYFLVIFSLFFPFVNFFNNFLKGKKSESFFYLVIPCALFQLLLGPFTMIGFKNYYVYSIITYILFSFGLLFCLLYTFFNFVKFKKNNVVSENTFRNFFHLFLKDFLTPWVFLVAISIFSIFFQSHFWDSAAYKTLSLNFRNGIYNWGGLGNTNNEYFLYQASAGYYVSSVLSTESIAFMYNYVWVVFFYSFFVFFSWDFYRLFIFKKTDKKSIIGLIIVHLSTLLLVFLHHYVVSASNVVYAAVILLMVFYYVKKQNFIKIYLSLLFVEFFTVSGSLLVLPILVGLFIYMLVFKKYKNIFSFILLFTSSAIGSLSIFTKPNIVFLGTGSIIFFVFLFVSLLFLLSFFIFEYKFNWNKNTKKIWVSERCWLTKYSWLERKIITKNIEINNKKRMVIFSSIFWLFAILQILLIFYISQIDKTYDQVPFIWCITSLAMSLIYFFTIYLGFKNKKILDDSFWYQLIQSFISTIFILFFFLIGNAYKIGILKMFEGIWNSSSWRLLMTIPGVDFPYGIFMVYLISITLLFENINWNFYEKYSDKFKFFKKQEVGIFQKKLIISSQLLCLFGSSIALTIYGLITTNDSTLITTNAQYLYDFNKEQKEFLSDINKKIKDNTNNWEKNLILADTPIFEYIRYANDYMGYNYNYWNYKDAQNKRDFTIHTNQELWQKYNSGWLQKLISEEEYNFKMVFLTKPISFYEDRTYADYYSEFEKNINSELNTNLSWKVYDDNKYYKIWYIV